MISNGLKHYAAIACLLFLPATFLMLSSGCSDTPSCGLLYKRLTECEEDFALEEEKFLDMCNKRRNRPRVKEQIACSKHSNCVKFKKCLDDAVRNARIRDTEQRIEEALKEKRYSQGLMICRYSREILTEALKTKCNSIAKLSYWEIRDQSANMLGEGGVDEKRFRVCSELKVAAKEIGEEKVKEAEGICQNLDIASHSQEAIEKAREALKDAKTVPFNCEFSLKRIAAAGTEFADKMKNKVIRACYIDLGAEIMEKEIPKMKRFCPYQVKMIYNAVKKHRVKDPKIDHLIEQAKPLCEK